MVQEERVIAKPRKGKAEEWDRKRRLLALNLSESGGLFLQKNSGKCRHPAANPTRVKCATATHRAHH